MVALNKFRRAHRALRADRSLAFHDVDNEQLLCYSKRAGDDRVLVVVNLDPRDTQSGWVSLDLEQLGLEADMPFSVRDALSGETYAWRGSRNFVLLDPRRAPAHLFAIA